MSTVKKIRSGGQTGADMAGLLAGKALGLETGGLCPKGWKTDAGPCPDLAQYGVTEHPSSAYPPRTEENVKAADATVIFGDVTSPGCSLTIRLCKKHGKPYFWIPYPKPTVEVQDFRRWLAVVKPWELNIAGNRERTNPGIGQFTYDFLVEALS